MKCSFCGSEKLVKTSKVPFGVSGDARMFVNDDEIFICLDCAHIELFNHFFVKEYYDKLNKFNELKNKVKELDNQISRLQNKEFDEKKYEKELKRYNDERDTLIKLGADNKSIKAKDDSIKYIERILNDRIEPGLIEKINNLKYEKMRLEEELSKYHFND